MDALEGERKMNAVTKVAQYLGINQKFIVVQEWAKVYWVHVTGKRPTLLSKKMVDRASEIRVGYTVDGNAIIKDERTAKLYLIAKPVYGVTSYGVYEMQSVSQYSEPWQGKKVGEVFANQIQKPSNLRDLMVIKSVRNAA